MEKYTKDGKVAILLTSNYGAGWSSWATDSVEEMLFCPEIVEYLLKHGGDNSEDFYNDLEDLANKLFPEEYTSGVFTLRIEWVEVGKEFIIHEYDGSEMHLLVEELPIIKA